MADEGIQNFHVDKDDEDVLSRRSIWAKVGEVVVSIIAVALLFDPLDSFNRVFMHQNKPKLDDIAFIYVTLAGYIIINAIIIIGYLLGDRIPKRTAIIFAGVGTIMHLVAAILIVNTWRRLHGNYSYMYNDHTYPSKLYSDMLISSGILTFINVIIYGADIYFTVKRY